MSGTLPRRGSSGRTSRSRSPRNASTITPNRWLRSLTTTTGSRVAGARRRRQVEHLCRLDEPDRLVVHHEVPPPFEHLEVIFGEPHDPVNPVQGKA